VAGSEAGEQRTLLLAGLEIQRRRLAALATWLLERGLAGEAVAAKHIEEAIASAVAGLGA
jgi:hypothetical protein